MAGSELLQDLRQIPNIIGALGLAVAESQKHFDEEYLRGIERLVALARTHDTGDEVIRFLLQAAAPSRYQFTETSLAVKLDLAQSRDSASQGGLGFGFAGAVISGAYAANSAQDYRAGAEVRVTLHAVLPGDNQAAFVALLDRVKQSTSPPVTLPTLRPADEKVHQALAAAVKALK